MQPTLEPIPCTGATGGKRDFFAAGKVPVLALFLAVGADKKAQGCTGEGLKPEGLSPRLRARMQAVTCEMVHF